MEYKQQYEKVNEEFLEFKKIFCGKCLSLEEVEIFGNKSANERNLNVEKSQQFGSVVSRSNEFRIKFYLNF